MRKLIINADDFGYSAAVNAGILYAHQHGVLTSTTLMAHMQGSIQAIQMAKENPSLGVGCHLTLTAGSPLLKKQSSITKANGEFYRLQEYHRQRANFADQDIYEEWSAQIDYLLAQGVSLTHLDSHHHVHAFQENLAIAEALSKKYQLPLRNCFGSEPACAQTGSFLSQYCMDVMNGAIVRNMEHSFHETKEQCFTELRENLKVLQAYEISECMVHPAFVDEQLYFHSSFHIQRMREVEILCDVDFKKLLQELGFQLCTYKNAESKEGDVK